MSEAKDIVAQEGPPPGAGPDGFPWIVESPLAPDAELADALTWIANERDRLIHLASSRGIVLFRDFRIRSDQDFDAVIQSFDLENFPYDGSLSNAVRKHRTPRVFTANEAPPNVEIFLHHELAQTPNSPEFLFFYCESAPDSGGATPICRSDRLLKDLQEERPEFANRLRELGLRYKQVLSPDPDPESGQGRGWRATLGASNPSEAEAVLARLEYSWEWAEGNTLKVTSRPIAAILDLWDGRSTFYNQLLAAYLGWKDTRNDPSKTVTYGNGAPLDPQDIQTAVDIANRHTVDTEWKTGDFALLDNQVVMHGRRPFSGQRKVLASLATSKPM